MSTFVTLVVTLLLLAGCAVPATTTPTIEILNNEFSPSSITVSVGTTVIWKNQSNNVQTVYSDGEVFDGEVSVHVIASELKPGGAVGYAFSMTGSYPYYSQMDPKMTGVVIVQ